MTQAPLRILLAAASSPALISLGGVLFDVRATPRGEDLITSIARHAPEIVLLDDLATCRSLRAVTATPLVFVCSDDPDLIVRAFEAGAHDVVDGRCDPRVFEARMRCLLGRTRPAPARYEFGDLVVDPVAVQVLRNGVPVAITPTEYRLLVHFVEHAGIAHSRDDLLRIVWGHSWRGDTRLVDVHVARLRAKLGARLLETVRGVGYRFVTS